MDFELKLSNKKARVGALTLNGKKYPTPLFGIHHSQFQNMKTAIDEFGQSTYPTITENIIHLNENNIEEITNEPDKNVKRFRNNLPAKINSVRLGIPRLKSSLRPLKLIEIEDILLSQIESGRIDIYTFPDHRDYSLNEYNASMIAAEKKLMEFGIENRLLPILSLDQPVSNLIKKLDLLINSEKGGIGFHYRGNGVLSKIERIIKNLHDKDIWTHLTDLPMKLTPSIGISYPHVTSFRGFDSIVSKKYAGGGRKKVQDQSLEDFMPIVEKPTKITPIRMLDDLPKEVFSPKGLGYVIPQYMKDLCVCSPCKYLGSDIHDWSINNADLDRSLEGSSRFLHTIESGINEFGNIIKSISNDEQQEYLSKKTLVMQHPTKLNDIFPNIVNVDKSLFEYDRW